MKRHRQYTSGRIPTSTGTDNKNNQNNYPRYRFTSVNKGFEICDSYPELLVVPSSITDWELQQVARFRRLGRIPVLTWKAYNNNVALFRCSQPKVGMASNRSRADEHLIQSIAEANTIQNSVLYIMDARPKLNARVNKMRGIYINMFYYLYITKFYSFLLDSFFSDFLWFDHVNLIFCE